MNELTALWMESLRKNGSAFLRVKGRSMEPAIRIDQQVKIRPIRPEEVGIGDVVVFTHGCTRITTRMHTEEEFIVHRIVDKFRFLDKLYFVHRGDNANGAGKPAPEFTPHLYGAGRRGELAHPLSGMSIFGEDQLLGRIENDGCKRIRTRMYTDILRRELPLIKNSQITADKISGNQRDFKKSAAISDYLLRKLTIYFFIFKQLLKKTLRIQTDRGTDANG